MRSYRGGNRQLNAALHQIAMTQIKKGGPAELYYRRRRAERDEHGYAISGVKRRIARTVFNRLRADQQRPPDPIIVALARSLGEWETRIRELDTDPAPFEPLRGRVAGCSPLPETDPRLADLIRINDEWVSMLREMDPDACVH
jgi:hypothetical protein